MTPIMTMTDAFDVEHVLANISDHDKIALLSGRYLPTTPPPSKIPN